MGISSQDIKVTYGPSLQAARKAVVASYSHSHFGDDNRITSAELESLNSLLPATILKQLSSHDVENVDDLLVALTEALINLKGELDLEVKVTSAADGRRLLGVEYLNEAPVKYAIEASFLVVSHLKSSSQKSSDQIKEYIEHTLSKLALYVPEALIRGMLSAAKQQQLPFFPLDLTGSLVSYGQGKNSVLFSFGCSQFDSHIGFKLQQDKSHTNAFLKTIGYPTTDQMLASTLDVCIEIIKDMGFPVVIKPPYLGRGKGVTSNIRSMDQVEDAYRDAARYSRGKVLIEKFVVGDDYRLTVAQGKVNGIICRRPACVVGDGRNTIKALINIENKKRLKKSETQIILSDIVIDDALIQLLKMAGLTLNNIPGTAEQIILRSNSNLSTGGKLTIIEEEDVHPDNLEMAIDVARSFRLDSVGVDFITPDILRSWRDIGVIIEINAHPMQSRRLAAKLLKNQFSNSNNGRIETTLVVTNNQKFGRKMFNKKQNSHQNFGYSDAAYTSLNGGEKTAVKDGLYERCLSLLINPSCDGIMIAMRPEEITESGFPIDYFDHCVIDLESNFDSEHINSSVKMMSGAESLEAWLMKYVGQIEKQ